MPKIKNINELRIDLLENYDSLKSDPRRLAQASELANIAGKVIASLKIELEYCATTGVAPTIEFLNYPGSHAPAKQIDITPPKQLK